VLTRSGRWNGKEEGDHSNAKWDLLGWGGTIKNQGGYTRIFLPVGSDFFTGVQEKKGSKLQDRLDGLR